MLVPKSRIDIVEKAGGEGEEWEREKEREKGGRKRKIEAGGGPLGGCGSVEGPEEGLCPRLERDKDHFFFYFINFQ